MTNVHAVTARTTTSVQEERLILLIAVQDTRQVTVAEEDLSSQKAMGSVAGDLLEALQQSIIDETGTKLSNELVVVNGLSLAILANFSRHRPGIDVLLASGLGLPLLLDWERRIGIRRSSHCS